MATDSGGSIKPVAVVIVGADALLAARPATPIQLWHAFLASGYDLAVPATWGDELIAAECLRAVGTHGEPVTVMCSCPMVARALGDGDPDLADHLLSLVAPPVATARYLHRVYGDRRVHITFVGACPAAGDSAIDAWVTPPEMLERFTTTGIDLGTQPQLFESVLPPDRRRHASQPGGVPTVERAAALPRPRRVVEIHDGDVVGAIRRHIMSGAPSLLDAAPRLGCACSGVTIDVAPADARLAVTLLEPPRSNRPVIAEPGGLALLRRTTPRPVPRINPPSDRAPGPGEAAGGRTLSDRERIVATSRVASRSPLSWNLRERALPQPPTSGVRSDGEVEKGASSGRWAARRNVGEAKPEPSTEPDPSVPTDPVVPDPATRAAVRALESASKGRIRGENEPAASPPVSHAGTSAPGAAPAAGRPTPTGGYWFVAERTAHDTDTEVARASSGVGDAHREPGEARDAGPAETQADAAPDAASDVIPDAAPRAEPEAKLEAEPSARPADADGEGEGKVEPTPPPRGEVQRDSAPPDRPWVIIMTIILLLAGGMVARDVARRADGNPPAPMRSVAGRAESTSAGSLQLPPDPRLDGAVPGADETARRAAHLDSIRRAVGTMYAPPRPTPAAVAPGNPPPPVSPPSASPPSAPMPLQGT